MPKYDANVIASSSSRAFSASAIVGSGRLYVVHRLCGVRVVHGTRAESSNQYCKIL